MKGLPLAGITVVSLEQAVAGPYATRQLADMGARVIKIERPDGGDFARGYDESVFGQSSYFVWLNRSKESLALNLKDPHGFEVLVALLEKADVLVDNLAPGAMERLGLSNQPLHEQFPRLITCEISGYGDDGPWSGRKAYDLLVQSESGLVSVTGDGEVMAKVGISVADIAAGMFASSAVLAALFRRTSTGIGGSIQVSLFDALMEWMGSPMYHAMYTGRQPERRGVSHPTIAPYGLFSTRDGRSIVIAVQNEREWSSMCGTVLGDPTLVTDERFLGNAARVANRDALDELIGTRISSLDEADAVGLLGRSGVAYAHVNSIEDAINHPALSGRNRWSQVMTPRGQIRALIPPADLSGADAPMRAVPALGEHTRAILAELGRSDEQILSLERDQIVGTPTSTSAIGANRP
jgi:itaconate CoA-transferase